MKWNGLIPRLPRQVSEPDFLKKETRVRTRTYELTSLGKYKLMGLFKSKSKFNSNLGNLAPRWAGLGGCTSSFKYWVRAPTFIKPRLQMNLSLSTPGTIFTRSFILLVGMASCHHWPLKIAKPYLFWYLNPNTAIDIFKR